MILTGNNLILWIRMDAHAFDTQLESRLSYEILQTSVSLWTSIN